MHELITFDLDLEPLVDALSQPGTLQSDNGVAEIFMATKFLAHMLLICSLSCCLFAYLEFIM